MHLKNLMDQDCYLRLRFRTLYLRFIGDYPCFSYKWLTVAPLGMYAFGHSNSSLRAWVRDRFVPLVMVTASDAAESVCREKNGLSLVDILRPFGEQHDLNAPLRVSGNSVRITETRLRFSYAHTLEQPTAEVIDTHLRDIVLKQSEAAEKLPTDVRQLEPTPWFLNYRRDFLKLLCFDAHETFDHPLGCIYAISSSESDSLAAFEALIDHTPWPTLMLQEYMAPITEDDIPKLYIIVHDGSKEGQTGLELAREKVRIVQRVYGHDNCALLLINTSGGKSEMRGQPPVPFASIQSSVVRGGGAGEHDRDWDVPSDGLGCYLSKADLERVEECIRNFMTRCFFPKLDVRISRLRAAVSHKRRGLTGRIMDRTSSLLKASLSNVGRDAGLSLGFKHYSDESLMRQLGDILFLFGRYEDALEVFTAISISKDTFPKFYAGVQLMIGLSYAMLVGFADPSVYFTRAYDYYLKVPGKISRMLATRAAMLQSAHCLSEGNAALAANVLLKGYDTEEVLRGALLLEQASILLLKTKPPSVRQFAFRMTLAGVWYYNGLFKALSLRSYNLVLGIYTNRSWDTIEQHVAATMLKFHLEQGNSHDAFNWTVGMLTSRHDLSPDIQGEYVKWICDYLKDKPSNDVSSISDFNLPVLDLDGMEVQYDGEIIEATGKLHGEVHSQTDVWSELEGRFRDPFSASSTTGLALIASAPEEPYGWVVCGEAVRVRCPIKNPLSTSIDVTSAQLLYEFERTDDSSNPTSPPVSVPERSFHLKASESGFMQLELIPKTPGRLRIVGVSWYLNDQIPGHKFVGKARWRYDGSPLPFRAKSRSSTLLFVALDPVPKLTMTSVPVPLRLWRGELWKQSWEVDSVGQIGFRNIQIATSSPDLTFEAQSEGFYVKKGVYQSDVEWNASMQFDVCFNPQTAGEVTVYTVMRYESLQSDSPLRIRYLRHSFTVEVVEALQLRSWLMASEMERRYILAMECENHLQDMSFEVTKIEAASPGFMIEQTNMGGRIHPRENILQHLLVKTMNHEMSNGAVDIKDTTETEDSSEEVDRKLGICVHWLSHHGVDGSDDRPTRRGLWRVIHDLRWLSTKIEFSVDRRTFTQSPLDGIGRFPINIRLRNVSHEMLRVTFKTGSEASMLGHHGWQQSNESLTVDAGRWTMPVWSWTQRTEVHVMQLMPNATVEIATEVVVFFTGTFCLMDYGCVWHSQKSGTSGNVPGPPLYLTVQRKAPMKSEKDL